MPVRVGVDGHRSDACFGAGSNDAYGNFAAVGYQDFLDQAAVRLCGVIGQAGKPAGIASNYVI